MMYSLIIPLYNRPDEIDELLQSLCLQSFKDFEVIVIEDGSKDELKADTIIEKYSSKLKLKYFYKENSGQGFSRNYGFEKASSDYFIILDSDCIIPPHYMQAVHEGVSSRKLDLFGGPDAAHHDFTPLQKAISYSMTSYFTTGGIRGKKKQLHTYHPRSFNMGLSRKVYEATKGFSITRCGEDIDLSIRAIKLGFTSGLIENAYVFHKRRTDWLSFYKQVRFFGKARINIGSMHPSEIKLIHAFPALFLFYCLSCLLALCSLNKSLALFCLPLILFTALVFLDSLAQNKNIKVALLSIFTSYIQLIGYGVGFSKELIYRTIFNKTTKISDK
jgi:glycosyltransferase involved in cell wall biosynthesis